MAKKALYDKSLVYDSQRLAAINQQVKKSPLYSNYIWTNSLHPMMQTPNPGSRLEFQQIQREMSRHKDKNSKTGLVSTQSKLSRNGLNIANSTSAPAEESYIRELGNKLEVARDTRFDALPVKAALSRFEDLYQEMFQAPQLLSPELAAKHSRFVDSVMHLKSEMHSEQPPQPEPLVAKPTVKKLGETKSAALLGLKHGRHRDKRPKRIAAFSISVTNECTPVDFF